MKRNSIIILFIFTLLIIGIPAASFSFNCVNTRFLFHITGDMDQPSDLSDGPNGNIYIVDGVNNRIVAVDSNGSFKFTFGKEGSGEKEFNMPLGIDVYVDGRVFVADTRNQRIQVFDAEGNFLFMFSTKLDSDRNPSDPVDVLVTKFNNGYIYVSDNNNHEIKVYDLKGKFKFKWGKFGEASGDFRYPATMSSNANNEVFVVDVLNTRAQKFSPTGNYINDIGSWGVHPGDFFRPKGIALSHQGWVFVSDSYMGVVQVFNDQGQFDGVICENNKKRVFKTPVGIFVDKDNRLMVVEMIANKITVLKIVE
ncbi:MAG: NHL repeat-containing protein [Thermodesulfovibrionia bacterium]|nr:NHL repeat-containing protein [Thermodesulfovibrionia bacterium]